MSHGDTPYKSEAGGPSVLWTIATAEEPVTVDELEEHFGVGRQSLHSVILRLYRSGFLVRRRREIDRSGGVPYEYAVAERPEADESSEGEGTASA